MRSCPGWSDHKAWDWFRQLRITQRGVRGPVGALPQSERLWCLCRQGGLRVRKALTKQKLRVAQSQVLFSGSGQAGDPGSVQQLRTVVLQVLRPMLLLGSWKHELTQSSTSAVSCVHDRNTRHHPARLGLLHTAQGRGHRQLRSCARTRKWCGRPSRVCSLQVDASFPPHSRLPNPFGGSTVRRANVHSRPLQATADAEPA